MSILARIRAHGGDVVCDQWRLRIRRGRLSDEALEWVKAHALPLHREVWPLVDEWHERAAIREFDGGLDREHAEREAYREIMARV